MLESKKVFVFIVTVILAWFLFAQSGYLFFLDHVFGPVCSNVSDVVVFQSNGLFFLIEFALCFILGAFVAQKLVLVGVLISLVYLPLVYFPELSVVNDKVKDLVKYVVSIFYVVNPFVWERFLAGQWGVLAGYALLWPFVYYLVEFTKEVSGGGLNEGRSTLKIFGYQVEISNFAKLLIATFLVGAVSFHFLIMCLVIIFFTFIYLLILNKNYFLTNFKKLFYVVGMFVVASSYWLVPTVWNMYKGEYVVQGFGREDVGAFVTNVAPLSLWRGDGGEAWTKEISIFFLYGFWGEAHPWAKQFDILPNQNSIVFLPVLIVILLGIVVLLRRDWRVGGLVFGGVVLSAIFSLGVADTSLKPVNQFLFDHVFFWKGFRDSQKWTGVLIVFMAIGLGYGLSYLLEKIKNLNLRIIVLLGVVLCIIFYTPKVLTGFSDKLRPVDYPATWYQANEVLVQDFKSGGQEGCVAIFLPWHMYYPLGFNNGLLTANPAQKFFDCKMYTSLDPEIGGVGVGVVKDKVAVLVHGEMQKFIDGDYGYEETVKSLRSLGVQYIVLSSDTLRGERFLNPKNVPRVEQIYDSADIAIFKL